MMLASRAPPDPFKQRPSIRRYWTGRLRIGSLPWCLTPQPPTWERTKAQKSISTNSLVFPLLSRLQTPCQWVAGQEPIQFYKNHIQYKQVDKVFADSALKTLSRHFGYLVPDTVIYSLFSDLVTEDKKSEDCQHVPWDHQHYLAIPPAKLNQNQNFIKAKEFVKTVNVVNDPAEQGIKLASDFSKSLTKDSSMRSLIFQVVEEARKTRLQS